MKNYIFKDIDEHIEVFSANGVFLFSADSIEEAWEEIKEEM